MVRDWESVRSLPLFQSRFYKQSIHCCRNRSRGSSRIQVGTYSKKCINSKFSKTQTYKMVDGKVEAGTEGYEYGNHEKFDHSTAMLLVDADFCRGV